ncbi:EAL domain-containing response regulator [Arhodomonas sp. AD133]|uniref:EAL domain-containing response regulator n=1 Tax=Arhodomonas sp. AD133 TaxID=3415009 RepID=UPI003EBCD138
MPDSDRTLRLLIAEESLNDAEQLVSVLRNAGHAVRPTRVEDAEQLEEALHGRPQDILLCAPGLGGLPLETAVRTVNQSGHYLALLVLTDEDDPELRSEVMGMGAADLVSKADTEHFLRVIERERATLAARRSQRRLEAALKETERRCQTLLESSRDAIAYVHEGMHIYANHAYLERFEVAQLEDIEGLPLLDLIAPDEQANFRDFFRQYTRGDASEAELETRIRTESGDEQDVRLTLAEGSWDGERATQIVIRENDEAALAERLQHLSRQDMLTGLYNRNHFLEHVDQTLTSDRSNENGAQHGLLYLRLDNVETIQHNLGISAVDQVVADTADLLRENVGDEAVAARYGDTLFAVWLRDASVHDALASAESIRQAIETHISELGERTITKSASIGVVVVGDNMGTAEQAMNVAATAAEQATAEGGNRVHLHAGTEDEGSDSGGDWTPRIEDAMADQAIRCFYQPVVALHDSGTARYELSFELEDDHGRVDGDTLRARADAARLAPDLDRYLIHQGLRALSASGDARPVLFITVSSASLADEELITFVRQQLADCGVHGSQLVLQFSEPVAVTQLNQARALAEGMRGLGGSTCLSSFGSGLDSFRLLSEVPVDYLRLDGDLVEGLASSGESSERTREIVGNAHESNRQVIADGLEEATQLAVLWQHQIDLVQGSFLQEPLPTMDYDFTGMVI